MKSVPERYKDFAQKCAEGMKSYKSPEENFTAYWTSFTEIDARQAGRTI